MKRVIFFLVILLLTSSVFALSLRDITVDNNFFYSFEKLFSFFEDSSTLICTSPKKGAATGYDNSITRNQLGINHFYKYSPYSVDHDTIPMMKRYNIDRLRENQDPDVCNYDNWIVDCPAKAIRETVRKRGTDGYWLILNEPEWEEDYNGAVGQMADDVTFTISFIKKYDPNGKFIVAWYNGIQNQWKYKAPNYGLDIDYNKVIAGWHIHTYHWYSSLYSEATINNYFNTFKSEILNHPAKDFSPNKELWLTEFGTLMYKDSPNCDDLNVQTGCECRFDRIDSDSNKLCVYFMEKLVNWLESAESPIDRYYWWSFGRCNPDDLGGSNAGNRDLCFGALTNKEGSNILLNNLGKAFAKIPSDNGRCIYGSSTTTTTTSSTTTTQRTTTTSTTVSSTTTTSTTIFTPQFTVTAFDCSETFTGNGIHECYIQYNSNVNARVVFLFVNYQGNVVNAPIPYAFSSQNTAGAAFDCNSQTIPSGTYHVSYRVYELSDKNMENEITWSNPGEIRQIVCQ